jgi:hypothetical protein
MRTRVLVSLVMALTPSIAAADKLEDMATNALKAYDVMTDVDKKYATLYAKYEVYYKPIGPQWDVVVKTRKVADDECAKNKRTVACRDKTLAYAAEHKKYNAMVWDKDNADPKHEFDDKALIVLHREVTRAKAEFQRRYSETAKAFEAAHSKVAAKSRSELDAKLAVREQKRADAAKQNTSVAADAKNRSSSSSSSSSSGSRGGGGPDSGAIMDSANKMGTALGKQ